MYNCLCFRSFSTTFAKSFSKQLNKMDKNLVAKILSSKIKMARNRLGYSQDYVALKLGISQKSYSNLENNITKLSIIRLLDLAELLEINTRELFVELQTTQQYIVGNEKGSEPNQKESMNDLKELLEMQKMLIKHLNVK